MKRITQALFVAVTAWALAASTALDAHDPIGSRVTWTGDIARIFQARCVGCHPAGSVDPMPLTRHEEVQPWASAIRQQVLSRKMPVWHAARGFGDFANDPSLSPFEIALIATWANAGAPRGNGLEPLAPDRPGSKPAAQKSREVAIGCGTQALSGRLLAVNPRLATGGFATIAAVLPGGRREVIAWIRDYDPQYPTTYWLRTPLALPHGSRLETMPNGECRLTVTLAR